LLFGKEFVKSIPTVRILGFVLIPIFLRFFLDTFVLALNKPNILFINYVIGTSINILMNLILIPKFKIFGCCLATISSELIMVGFCIFWIRKNLPQAIKTKIDSQWLLLNW
jgi:O-antigen/teichoic acid export membrane protein